MTTTTNCGGCETCPIRTGATPTVESIGNHGCAVRFAAGKTPFCKIVPREEPPRKGWPTARAAEAANPGKRIMLVGGHGGIGRNWFDVR